MLSVLSVNVIGFTAMSFSSLSFSCSFYIWGELYPPTILLITYVDALVHPENELGVIYPSASTTESTSMPFKPSSVGIPVK